MHLGSLLNHGNRLFLGQIMMKRTLSKIAINFIANRIVYQQLRTRIHLKTLETYCMFPQKPQSVHTISVINGNISNKEKENTSCEIDLETMVEFFSQLEQIFEPIPSLHYKEHLLRFLMEIYRRLYSQMQFIMHLRFINFLLPFMLLTFIATGF